tara:strand:- start:483 stop:1214 length:732 start_codon:yes stop_codon:yes gene_type:complete
MKITLHKKIAAYFGYEFVRINKNITQNQNLQTIELIKQYKIDLILDVGANLGQFASDMRRAGYQNQIISFEPIHECYKHLISIADSGWQVKNFALGNKNLNEKINISNKTVYSSILDVNKFGKSNFQNSIKVIDKQDIQVKKLDDIIHETVNNLSKKKVFLKIDTQGYDNRVIRGAAKTLKHVQILQTEISCRGIYEDTPSVTERLEELLSIGFSIVGIFPISRDKNTMEILEFDCLLIRRKE